jgi:hypothetical protein
MKLWRVHSQLPGIPNGNPEIEQNDRWRLEGREGYGAQIGSLAGALNFRHAAALSFRDYRHKLFSGSATSERQLEGCKTVLAQSTRCERQLLAGKGDTPP